MFNFLTLIAPGLKRLQIPQLLKYAKYLLIAVVIIYIGFISYKAYGAMVENTKVAKENAELVIEQRNTISKQSQDINNLREQMDKLQASHETTMASLAELRQQKVTIQNVTVTRKKKVDDTLATIEQQPVTEEDKDTQKSSVLIQDLNGTYCEFFPMNCKEVQ